MADAIDRAVFLNHLAAVSDAGLEILVLPYEAKAGR